MQNSQRNMMRIGLKLLEDSKAAACDSVGYSKSRDLLAVLVRANMAKDIPDSQRLSDAEVVSRLWFCLLTLF